jgi:hypothetical protein
MPGAYAGLIGGLAEMPGRAKGNRLTARLMSATDEELATMAGAAVYRTGDLASIACKRVVLGTNPDFVVTTKDGRIQKYGLANALNFDAVVSALRERYGDVVQQL